MRAERGFTLLEVLVALVISSLLLAAMVEATGLALRSAGHAGRYEEALSRCRSHIAALDPDVGPLAGESEGDDGQGYRWRLDISPAGPPGPSPVLYAVAVTISWQEGEATRALTLRTERLGRAR